MAELANLLAAGAVVHRMTANGRQDVLERLCQIVEDEYDLPASVVLESALERENLGGTGVGEGVAIPHARVRGITEPVGVLATLKDGVDFGSPDRKLADIIFLLISPGDAGADHLKALARITRSLRQPELREAIRDAHDATALLALVSAKAVAEHA